MSDMSNDRPIPVEAGGHLPDDTEGHLASLSRSDADPETPTDDTEGPLAALRQTGDDSDDTEGHLHSFG